MMRLDESPDPFGLASTPSAYVARASSERAVRALDNALIETQIPALIGAPGLGKTLLLQRVAARLDDHTAPVYIPYSILTLRELCTFVLGLVEEPITDDPQRELLHIIQELRRNRASLLLLIDDAAMMPLETAEQLAEWAEASKGALKIVLAAVESPEARTVFSAFGDRLRLIRLDEEMSLAETREYILRRLAIVGAAPILRDAFDDETIEILYRKGHGNPRAINVAAQSVVLHAMPCDTPRLDEVYNPSFYDIHLEEPAPFEEATRSVNFAATFLDASEGGILIDEAAGEPFDAALEPEQAGAGDCGSYRVVRGRRVKNAEGELGSYEGRSTTERIPVAARDIAAQIDEEEDADRLPDAPIEDAPQEMLLENEVALPEAAAAAVPAPMSTIVSRILELGDAVSRQPMPAGISIACAVALGLACGSFLAPATSPAPPAEAKTPSAITITGPAGLFTTTHAVGINATPWALIKVDGREIGETPIASHPFAEGRHVIRAYYPDGNVEEKLVDIDATTRAVVFE
jgi:type II secretory pathway predicted ATPase ExeA